MTKNLVVDEKSVGKRLDLFLSEMFSEFTRSHIKNLIEKGLVLVNGKVQKAGSLLKKRYACFN